MAEATVRALSDSRNIALQFKILMRVRIEDGCWIPETGDPSNRVNLEKTAQRLTSRVAMIFLGITPSLIEIPICGRVACCSPLHIRTSSDRNYLEEDILEVATKCRAKSRRLYSLLFQAKCALIKGLRTPTMQAMGCAVPEKSYYNYVRVVDSRTYFKSPYSKQGLTPLQKSICARVAVQVWDVLNRRGVVRTQHTFSAIGYSEVDLVAHIERQFIKGMSWDNAHLWHIDHVIPKSTFNIQEMGDAEFKACWALSNLRPLWGRDNLLKKNHRTHLL